MVSGVKTRSGRVSKVPQRLELFEEVEDDYKEDEYDSDYDVLQSDDEDFCSDDDEDIEDDEDADDNGNLKGFVVDDTDEDEDYSEEEEEYSE
jgi:hypothetical protein|tara:strand:- start:610 stop:885 length:276 start_codon:yes stop_codon:yes gene_type:complete